MGYSTKPYLFFGLFRNARMVTYSIDDVHATDRRFRERGLLAERASLPLADASATRIEEGSPLVGAVRKIFGLGDVLLAGANFSHPVKNIVNTNAFIAAVEGTHPDVQARRVATEVPRLSPDTPLEAFTICIPLVHGLVESLLYRLSRGASGNATELDGTLVRAGVTIAHISGIPVVAPVDGLLKVGSFPSELSRGPDWQQFHETQPTDPSDCGSCDRAHLLATIQPAKGADVTGYIQRSYAAVLTRLDSIDRRDRSVIRVFIKGSGDTPEMYEARWRPHVEALRAAKGRYHRPAT